MTQYIGCARGVKSANKKMYDNDIFEVGEMGDYLVVIDKENGYTELLKDEDAYRMARSLASQKAWETRKSKVSKKRSQASKKAWVTRKKNEKASRKRSQASKKAWETRRANEELKEKRSQASKKAWETRRLNERIKNGKPELPEPSTRVRLMLDKMGKSNES